MTWTEHYNQIRVYLFWLKLIGTPLFLLLVFVLGIWLEGRKEREREKAQKQYNKRTLGHE